MDYELVEKILQGDLACFEELVEKYQSLVFNLAYRFFANRQDAEDIAQEVFVKIFKNIEKCLGKESIKTWVYTLTHNTCIDEARKRKGKQSLSLDASLSQDDDFKIELRDTKKTPEELAQDKENIKMLESALNSLPQDARTLIYLRDIKELSYSEISEVLGINLGTVKSRISRARNQLKTSLKDKI